MILRRNSKMNNNNIKTQYDIYKTCRACLFTVETEMKSIFSCNLRNIYTVLTNLEMKENDGLPSNLCIKCVERLNLYFSFRNQCIKSENILKQSEIKREDLDSDFSTFPEKIEKPTGVQPNEIDGQKFEFIDVVKAEAEHISTCVDEKLMNHLKIEIKEPITTKIHKANRIRKNKIKVCKKSTPKSKRNSQESLKHQNKRIESLNKEESKHITDFNLSLSCPECNDNFIEASQLEEHFGTHLGDKKEICKICNGVYANAKSLKKHMIRHKGLRNHMCPECGKGFADKSYLRSHELIHRGIRSYICEGCGKSFHSNSNLKIHVAQRHSDAKPYNCNLCEKKFKTTSDLKSHQLTHTGIKKYLCNLCPHKARTNGDLKRHLKIHSDEKPHECTVCNKRFRTTTELSQHNSIHTGERPHQCDLCPMAFRLKIILQNHRRTHTGEKPHVCDICGKAFTQKVVLTTHMKTHSST